MRPGSTEFSLFRFFFKGLRARYGLAGPNLLASESFRVPFSFIFGEIDWVKMLNANG